ncbi:MAG: hypothetical protein HKP36_18345, partial [Myxococcales bacterium]|nr:hypothetical protein [Deltaproteobacteria bacterium]NNL26393.1 hypothetical protein [Myxococcales bacterium]
NPSGVGANAFGDQFRIDLSNPPGATGDSLRIEFFDLDGNARDASNVSVLLFTNGVGGMVSVTVDGGAALSLPATPGAPLVLPGTGHSFEVTLMNGVPTPYHTWSQLSYDHECL